jgi:hypothetical protein
MLTHETRIQAFPCRPVPSEVGCEHVALLRMLAGAQVRMSDLVAGYQQQIHALQAQVIRLRARVIVRDTLLAWLGDQWFHDADEQLPAHHAAADWVICQTGCISHGGYWREDDQCRRTGKICSVEGIKVEIPR